MLTHSIAGEALRLDQYLSEGQKSLGQRVHRADIHSSMGPFTSLPEYRTQYSAVVVAALLELYQEYNQQFTSLVEANREWETDYQYCASATGSPVNRWVQIDMVGLPDRFLEVAASFTVGEVKNALRHGIFEIENSLAMYQLLQRIMPDSPFQGLFLGSLDALRQAHRKKVALLAVTDAKYQALLADELGVTDRSLVNDTMVKELTGFDTIFCPDSFRAHVEGNCGACDYLLYVRSSDPVSKLRKPGGELAQPLLSDPVMRQVIKAHSLTFNVDVPGEVDATKRINDTKAYMPPMGMAYVIDHESDLFSDDGYQQMQNGTPLDQVTGQKLSDGFAGYLHSCGIDPEHVARGEVRVRCKPMQGTYGCYGHHALSLNVKSKKRQGLRADIRNRGTYLVQPELVTPCLVDPHSGESYGYIDRNFATIGLDGTPVFMGGFRSLLPMVSQEAQKGRFHGNEETVWAPIN